MTPAGAGAQRGFNRGHYGNPGVDALLDEAHTSTDNDRRRELFAEVQRIVAADVPCLSLWHIRTVIVAQRTLTGLLSVPDRRLFVPERCRAGSPGRELNSCRAMKRFLDGSA